MDAATFIDALSSFIEFNNLDFPRMIGQGYDVPFQDVTKFFVMGNLWKIFFYSPKRAEALRLLKKFSVLLIEGDKTK